MFFLEYIHYNHGDLILWLPWGSITIPVFFIFFCFTFVWANFLIQKEIFRRKLPAYVADNLFLLALLGGILGAKLFYLWEGTGKNFQDGLTWYGGLFLSGICIILYLKKIHVDIWNLADALAWILAAGYGFGRLGCMLSGDGCYGIQSPSFLPFPWSASFPNGSYPWELIVKKYKDAQVTVYNTPLIEAMFSFILAFALNHMRKCPLQRGSLFFSFLLLHALFRFCIEFLRQNPPIWLGLTQAQILSTILIIGIFLYLICRKYFSARSITCKRTPYIPNRS